MRLIDRIRAKEFNYWSKVEHLIPRYLDSLSDPDLMVIDVSAVADYLAIYHSQSKQSFREIISSSLPPFTQCWMECTPTQEGFLPPAMTQAGALLTTFDLRDRSLAEKHIAADLIGIPTDRRYDLENIAWVVLGEFSTLADNGALGCLHSIAYFLLDEQGRVLRPMLATHYVDDQALIGMHLSKERGDEVCCNLALEIMAVFGMAASFMSCKNVQLIENQAPRHERRQREREKKPLLTKYYTLEIEPMKKILRTEGRSEEVGLKKALHICRGHFAHYTPDRPLFGKVSGRFWIPAHVRGSQEAGEIKKDYRVLSPKKKTEK